MALLRQPPLADDFAPFVAFRKNYGFVPNFFRAQALLPRLIEAESGLEAAILMKEKALSRVQKERILLIVAAKLQDTYWVTTRAAVLQSLGVSKSEVAQLLQDFHQAGLPVAESALIDFCVKLTSHWDSVGRDDIEWLRSYHFEDMAILEAVLTCALARFLSVISAGVKPEPDFDPYTLPAPSAPPKAQRPPPTPHPRHGAQKGPYIATAYLSPKTFPPFAGILKTHGFIPNVYRAQSLRPDVLEAASGSVGRILIPEDVLARVQKECIFVAVSAAILNSYCVAAHCNLLRGFGLPPEEGDQVALDHHQANLPETDKLLLDFAIKLAVRPAEICAEDVDAVKRVGFTDAQILECQAIIALSNYVNMLQIGLGAEPDFDLPPRYQQKKVYLPEFEERPTTEGPGAAVVAAAWQDPDAGLVARAQAGDLEAFEDLIRRHSSSVYRVLMAILGDPEESQDAMQDALLSAFKHVGGFQGRSKFSTWLVSIARNSALQRLRNRKNVESLDDPAESQEDFRPRQVRAWQDDPEQIHSKAEIRQLVEKGILGLPAKYRIVVMLRDIEQLSTEEVARQLGLSVPALKARLLRGRLMLRESLAPYFAATAGKAAI